MSQVYALRITATGLAKYAAAQLADAAVRLSDVAVGDGGGAPIAIAGDETALYGQVGAPHPVIAVAGVDGHPTWIKVTVQIPAEAGGFTMREVGIYDDEADLIAIGAYPEQYKPALAEGFGEDLLLDLIFAYVNAGEVITESAGSSIYPTVEYLERRLSENNTWYWKQA